MRNTFPKPTLLRLLHAGLILGLGLGNPGQAEGQRPSASGEDARMIRFVMEQPAYSAAPVAGSEAGPVWTTRNVDFALEGCVVHWTRHFAFSVGPGGDPAQATTFETEFGGEKSFRVDLGQISQMERTSSAPNTLADVDYALGEIIFRGDGILSGGDVVQMSGIIIGGEEVRRSVLEWLESKRGGCAGE